jgi:chromosome segregation ATPase
MMNEENEISNINREPTQVLTAWVRKPSPDGVTKTEDYAPWLKDIEETRARSAELAEKRRQAEKKEEVNVLAELDRALESLEAGADDFQNSFGEANQPLIDAKIEVDRLRHELAASEQRLAEIESKGNSVSRLQQSVLLAEGALNGLLSAAESQAMNKLIIERFGWLPPSSKIQRETLRELALDISVQSLKEFKLPRHHDLPSDPTQLQKRMDVAGERLTALRSHLEQE